MERKKHGFIIFYIKKKQIEKVINRFFLNLTSLWKKLGREKRCCVINKRKNLPVIAPELSHKEK